MNDDSKPVICWLTQELPDNNDCPYGHETCLQEECDEYFVAYFDSVIDTEGLDEQIRCEMCSNPMRSDRGCDGNCKYDEKLYERIIQMLDERIKPSPSAELEHEYTMEEFMYGQDMGNPEDGSL